MAACSAIVLMHPAMLVDACNQLDQVEQCRWGIGFTKIDAVPSACVIVDGYRVMKSVRLGTRTAYRFQLVETGGSETCFQLPNVVARQLRGVNDHRRPS